MVSELATAKGLITRFCNKLEQVLARFKEQQLDSVQVIIEDHSRNVNLGNLCRLEGAVGTIESIKCQVDRALRDLSLLAEKGDPSEVEQYVVRAEDALVSAVDYVALLQANISALKSFETFRPLQAPRTTAPVNAHKQEHQVVELPPLPIPKFTGDIWDFDNFWELFNVNVHSRGLPELFKFNYLLNALEGEAKESVKKFQVTPENYSHAIKFLHARYGNPEELIQKLIDKLDHYKLRSESLKDQRTLFEQVQVTVLQLKQKGEHVDNQVMVKKVLSKFPAHIQRRVLAKRRTLPSITSSTMETLFNIVEDVLSEEEMMNLYVKEPMSTSQITSAKEFRKQESLCMYCEGIHKSSHCDTYKTPRERTKYLRDRRLCQLCASPQHKTSECKRKNCFRCGGPHHSSCCFKITSTSNNTQEVKEQVVPAVRTDNKVKKQVKKTQKVNVVAEKEQVEEDQSPILEVQAAQEIQHYSTTVLPIGEVMVMDNKRGDHRRVPVLLDTGAEISFIDRTLADELELETISEKTLLLHTFGSEEIQKKKCRIVRVQVQDVEGRPHELELTTHKILIKPLRTPPLLQEDTEFLKSLNISIQHKWKEKAVKPLILLGCDQVWKFWKTDEPPVPLPSGLQLLPTKTGNLITGRYHHPSQVLEVQSSSEAQKWDKYWSLDVQVNTVWEDSDCSKEEDKWDRYWTLENEGTQEFNGTEEAEKASIDKKVWDKFNETIQRRDDGYYVRLPWKENWATLPDNKAIALRRLVNSWNSLQRDPELLQMYNNVFEEQLRLNIVEEVPKHATGSGSVIHYIPHQAVLTPNKLTTKLRIVFDASAHYKGCPSLNQVLHRGPVILPPLFGILLRFRIGKIGFTSDVEKAFLQVRLQEIDRDATRCLWLYDHNRPPTLENIKTLRFTRVTFGLNSSPFLLAATTHFHLNSCTDDTKFVEEIKNNLYVDNLLLTADTLEEASRKYEQVKQMFRDLSMNMREFVSNDPTLLEVMATADKSRNRHLKVLEIKWDSSTDKFQIACSIELSTPLTKRTVASSVASIYDPLGWMTPLTHKAKVFIQSLWKGDYKWDDPLSEQKAKEWIGVVESMRDFYKELPRFISKRSEEQILVAFADASTEGMATCIYMCSNSTANLVMAREKLPSIRSSLTIPKMELNAITLAMRVVNALITQVHMMVRIKMIYIFTDSEIILNWIKDPDKKEKGVLINNRLREIKQIVEHLKSAGHQVYFLHVPSSQNPADCATRGLHKNDLQHHMWWNGPTFLHKPISELVRLKNNSFPSFVEREDEEVNEEALEISTAATTQATPAANGDLISSKQAVTLTKAKKILAYVIRFIRLTASKLQVNKQSQVNISAPLRDIPRSGKELSGREIKYAGQILLRHHQQTWITPAILQKLRNLNVLTDSEGIMRCIGRLGKSEMKDETKYPILILQKTTLADFIIQESHLNGHPGINHTMSIVRQKFWIPQLRSQVMKIVRKCIACQKFNNLPCKYPEQPNLPKERVVRSRPFEHVGLDYFGPLSIVTSAKEKEKCYGVIVTCMVTRLIHLDIVSDQSTKTFLQMLRRFFARRGVPSSITSDNSPTFLLGETILKECSTAAQSDPAVARELSNKEIDWHYITPYAPWQGGFYERLIKSIKHSLYKTIGKSALTFEELLTVIVEIEALLNTRPLLYSDSSLDQDSILRPIDFLQRDLQVTFPFESLDDELDDPSYATFLDIPMIHTKAQAIQALQSSCKLTEKFWQIWHTQYLTALREKHQTQVGKKRSAASLPEVGKLVLISDEVQPRHTWRIGRIETLPSNKNGVIREAVIRLPSHKRIRRPLNVLIPLELEGSTENKLQHNQKTDPGESYEESRRPRGEGRVEEPLHSYNLRSRPQNRQSHSTMASISSPAISASLFTITLCSLALLSTSTLASTSTVRNPIIASNHKTSTTSLNFKFNNTPKSSPSAVKLKNPCTLHFRMAERDVDPDATYLSRLMIRSHPSADRMEDELEACLNEIKHLVSTSASKRRHFNFLTAVDPKRRDNIGDRFLHLNKFVRSAVSVKEALLRLGTRYILTERIYAQQANNGGLISIRYEDWLAGENGARKIGAVNKLIEDELRLLMAAIEQAEKVQETMEQVLRDEYQRMGEEHSPQVQQLLQQHEEEVNALKARIALLEQQMAKPEQMPHQDKIKETPHQSDMELSDEDYLLRLIEENQDDENPAQNVDEARKEHEKRTDVKFLREYEAKKQVLERMEDALNSFPYRRYTQYSDGVEPWRTCIFCGARAAHYSDSCPTIRNAIDREQVAYTLKLCKLCLENCEEGRCIKGRRACWYCSKIEGTPFKDVIPPDKGHHRALCPVPDAKWRIEARVQAAARELQEMERNRHSRRGMSRH